MSEIIVTFTNESIREKILYFLSKFEADGVQIQANSQNTSEFSDEYVEKNWRKILSNSLESYDYDDERWKLEYGEHLARKHL